MVTEMVKKVVVVAIIIRVNKDSNRGKRSLVTVTRMLLRILIGKLDML